MNSADSNMLKPILIGGVAMGVASSIPVLGCLNACCCLLIVAGGALASWLNFKDQSFNEPPYGPAAFLGLSAGVVGGVVSSILTTLINLATGSDFETAFREGIELQDIPPESEELVEQIIAFSASPLMPIIVFVVTLVVFAAFSTLGAIIAVALLQKKGGGTPPVGGGYAQPSQPGTVGDYSSPGPMGGGTPPPPSAPPSNLPPPPQ